MKKRLVLLMMMVLMVVTSFVSISAEETDSISVLNQNVDGLPFQYLWGNDVRAISISQKRLGKLLNESGYDVICVQEDFQFHNMLASSMKDYKYQTTSSGGVPVGSGLNVFSKYPIYNVERVTWDQTYGALSNGCDELTSKGFMKVTVDKNGVLVDIYNLHAEADKPNYTSYKNEEARLSQYKQLLSYIEKDNSGNPIIIVGDINDRFHEGNDDLYNCLVKDGKFTDGWVHLYNNDDYFQNNNKQDLIDYYENLYPEASGNWDSIERILYRGSSAVTIQMDSFGYQNFSINENNKKSLTDHCACYGKFTLRVNSQQDNKLQLETIVTVKERIIKTIKCTNKTLKVIVKDVVKNIKKGFIR